MSEYRRPDVYIEEKISFPGSILEIESAIPVFIGYTEKDPTPGEPKQINSLQGFIDFFGGPHPQGGITFSFDPNTRQVDILPKKIEPIFMLYYAMSHYFKNGGAKCFVISSGTYAPAAAVAGQAITFDTGDFLNKVPNLLDRALEIEESTIFVIPELVKFAAPAAAAAAAAALAVAASTAAAAAAAAVPPTGSAIAAANAALAATAALAAVPPPGAAYADIVSAISGALNTLQSKQKLEKFFILDVVGSFADKDADIKEFDDSGIAGWSIERTGEFMAFYYPYLETTFRLKADDATIDAFSVTVPGSAAGPTALSVLKAGTVPERGFYEYLKQQIQRNAPSIILPPSAAMAGIYVSVDNLRGVWKAPANVSVSAINGPNTFIDDTFHEDLNINPLNGRSICAIRNLPGYGTRVMGGRTLRGSSNDFRYINVRRFTSIVEKSIKNAMKQYLFEPNNPATWGLVKGGISNYLSRKWLQGALLGAKAEDSFFVRIGLGITMSQDDVLNGRMIVDVGMAVVRPAEFIILRFEQFLPTQLS